MDDNKIIPVIKKSLPAVVSIIIEKNFKDVQKQMPHQQYSFMPGQLGAKKKFSVSDLLADPNGMVKVGGGTGFIVDSKGLIFTNRHVVDEANAEYIVILSDGRKFNADIISRDPVNDVAILSIPAKNLPIIPLGDASRLELGQSVIAIGNALGIFQNTVSIGIVSGLSRAITARENPDEKGQELRGLIQTDAAINVGNSGGPLINLKGQAIGVNSAVIPGAHSIGFAIPINAAMRDLKEVKKFGRIRRPYLGLRYLVLDETLQDKTEAPVDFGAWVINETEHDPGVVPGSPADKAGIKENDIVLFCDGKKVDISHPIQDYLEDKDVDQLMVLTILRKGKQFDVKVKLTERK